MARKCTSAIVIACTLVLGVAASSLVSAAETITYTYDAKGRLVKIVHTGTVNNNVVSNYTFDNADNRKTVKVTGAP
jgi:hypothetical protein